MSATVMGPTIAETLGWLAPTMEAVPGRGTLLHTPITTDIPHIRSSMFVLVLVGAGVLVAYFVRRADDELRRKLHLQAWHVRQLFPAG
jgi:hypothetical protein